MDGQLSLILYSLVGGFIPAAIWLWFWLREDKLHPEPAKLIALVFLGGGLAVIAAYFLERLVCNFDLLTNACQIVAQPTNWSTQSQSSIKLLLVIWAVIEEILKFVVAYLIVFRRSEFDEPVDTMIYLITAALGFAAIENAFFLFNMFNETNEGLVFLLTGNLRFLGANLVHVVSSAILGGLLALAFKRRLIQKLFLGLFGLSTAIILHALFNLLIIIDKGVGLLKTLSLLWLFVILIIWLFEKVKKQYV